MSSEKIKIGDIVKCGCCTAIGRVVKIHKHEVDVTRVWQKANNTFVDENTPDGFRLKGLVLIAKGTWSGKNAISKNPVNKPE